MEKNKKKIFIYYSLLFLICCAIVFFVFIRNNMSLVYYKDGWMQYLKAYIYLSDYLKEIFKNIFVNHKLVISQWSFSIGEGADILGTFNTYVLGDPITFLVVFVPREYIYLFLNFSVILRLYLSGISFIILCLYKKKNNVYSLLSGSIIYVFCYWCIFNSVRHIHFINPMIIMPLMIMSIEKIINNEKPYMFTFMVFITAISSFYFFCIIVIIVVVYVLIRLLVLYKKDIKNILNKILILAKYSLIGVLMAAVVVLPMLYVFTDDFRLDVSTNLHILYPIYFYKKLPSMFLSTGREYWLCMGYAAPVILTMIISFLKRKDNHFLLILNLVTILFIVTPIFGQITNGLKYVTNKWAFSISLVVAYNLVEYWEYIYEYRKVLSILCGICFGVLLVLGPNINIIIPIILCLIFFAIIWLVNEKYKIKQTLLLAIICLNVCFNGLWCYTKIGMNYVDSATSIESNKNILTSSEAYLASEYLDDDEFYRFSGADLDKNASLLFDTHSTDFYWSLSNKYISRYRNDLGIAEYSMSNYIEYNQRATLLTLANVKYYFVDKDYSGVIPYGFEYYKTIEDKDAYINKNYLPFGYTYSKTYSYDLWSELNDIQKQLVLSSAVVLENCDNSDVVDFNSKTINYTITCNEGIELKENKFIVKNKEASVKISFEKVKNVETFFAIEGLNYSDGKSWLKNPNTMATINLNASNGINKYITYATEDEKYQQGREDFAVNFGYEEGVDEIVLTFSDEGTYSYDNISIILLECQDYESNINALKEDVLENVVFDTNKISGTIDLDSNKYLVMSIPYSKGWTAYVDGKQAETLVANDCYTGLELTKGHHTIELRYSTPYLKEGLIVSCAGILLYVADYLIKKRKHEG